MHWKHSGPKLSYSMSIDQLLYNKSDLYPKFGKSNMIDTCNLFIDAYEMAGGFNPLAIAPCLSNADVGYSERRGHYVNGTLGEYQVFAMQSGISLKGSLASYYLHSNVYTLTRKTAAEAFEKISDELHCDIIHYAKITRLDISTILPMIRPPQDYFQCLGAKPHFKRLLTASTTLQYNTKQRQLVFYNKNDEARAKGKDIPPSLMNCNLLRYEMRFASNLPRQLKCSDVVTPNLITQPDQWANVVQIWGREYEQIRKLSKPTINKGMSLTPKEAEQMLLSMLLNKVGPEVIEGFLADLRAADAMPLPKYYSMLRARLMSAMKGTNGESNEMADELSRKIKEKVKYAR